MLYNLGRSIWLENIARDLLDNRAQAQWRRAVGNRTRKAIQRSSTRPSLIAIRTIRKFGFYLARAFG
jgi:hypothetical protein